MKRLLAVVLVALGVATGVAAETASVPELQATIAALQTQVAVLQGTPQAVAFEVTGTGNGVVPPFDVRQGSYSVTFTCSADPSTRPWLEIEDMTPDIVVIYFGANIDPDEPGQTNDLLQVSKDTRATGQVDCSGEWTITGVTLG